MVVTIARKEWWDLCAHILAKVVTIECEKSFATNTLMLAPFIDANDCRHANIIVAHLLETIITGSHEMT